MIKQITIISLIILGLAFTFFVLADTVSEQESFIYRFHLYYDNGQLFANRDFEFKYDVIPDDFVSETISTNRAFRGEIISGKEEVLHSFQFDPQKGNSAFKEGSIAVDGPYFANAANVNFYNDENQLLLTLDVSGSSFCNDDGICNSDVGENYQNCPNDCPRPSPVPVVTPASYSIWKDPLLIGLTVLAAIVVVLVVLVIIRRRKAAANFNQNLPPAQPLS